MRPKTKDIDLIDTDADGIAAAQAVGAAGNLTLAGALTSGGTWTASDGMARVITILSAGNDSGITFTVTGFYGSIAQTEVITGANAGTATGSSFFTKVTRIAASAAAAGNVSAGIGELSVTPWIPLNHYNSEGATVSIEGVSGSLDVTVEESFSQIQTQTIYEEPVSALSNVTTDSHAQISVNATAVRLKVNNYLTGAECQMVVNQVGAR